MDDLKSYVGLFVQIPIVFIFVWYSNNLVKTFMDSLEKRDAQWQQFLDQQRKQYIDAISHMVGRFADEVKVLGKEIAELKGKLE